MGEELGQEMLQKLNPAPELQTHLVTQLLSLIMPRWLLMLTSNFLQMTITLHQIKLHYLTPSTEVYLLNRWRPHPGEI